MPDTYVNGGAYNKNNKHIELSRTDGAQVSVDLTEFKAKPSLSWYVNNDQ